MNNPVSNVKVNGPKPPNSSIGSVNGNGRKNTITTEKVHKLLLETQDIIMIIVIIIVVIFLVLTIHESIMDDLRYNINKNRVMIYERINDCRSRINSESAMYPKRDKIVLLNDIILRMQDDNINMNHINDVNALLDQLQILLQNNPVPTGSPSLAIPDTTRDININVFSQPSRDELSQTLGDYINDRNLPENELDEATADLTRKSKESLLEKKIDYIKLRNAIPSFQSDVLNKAAALANEKDQYEKIRFKSLVMARKAHDTFEKAKQEIKQIDSKLLDLLYSAPTKALYNK